MRYRPYSSRLPIKTGSPLHVMSTSSSLCTVTPSLVKIEILPSSAVLPTLNKDDEKSVKVSASAACLDNFAKGSEVTNFPLLVPPLATSTRFVDLRKIGKPAIIRSFSLM